MPFCNHCGTQFKEGETLCTNCNMPLPKEIQVHDNNQTTESPKATRKQRIFAGLIDIFVAMAIAKISLSPKFLFAKAGIVKFAIWVLPILYLLLKDSIEGKSIGKLLAGITAYNTVENKPAGFADSILRNWPLFFAAPFVVIFPCIPGPLRMVSLFFAIPLIALFFQIGTKNRRWGDGMANTIVIKDSKL